MAYKILTPILKRVALSVTAFAATACAVAQSTAIGQLAERYLIHSSGLVLTPNADASKAVLTAPDEAVSLRFIADGTGYYSIQYPAGGSFLALSGSWNTTFTADSADARAKFAIESATGSYLKLRCKSNGKYLGTDATTAGSSVFADKSGSDTKHYWYLGTTATQEPDADTVRFAVNPSALRQTFEGWGVSLCWWANVCGSWDEEKVDQLVDWLVSPTGLNFRLFRYNIGGGDDPENRNCTAHHMGNGKGLRAEMEGFKDSTNADYDWTRDAAQRNIMLKIKAKRPDAVFEAFSNSAPYYMTYSGCCAGNTDASKDNLKPEYYEEFAHYLVDVCRHYKDEYGIEFRTLDPFNEPMTSYWGAGGGQEGCHFDVSSQSAFLKVLAPILQESGLNTIISAADETSVAQSVNDFKAYETAGTLDLVGQWNAHSYTADNKSRTQLAALCGEKGMRLWMSEVGQGGSGIAGNLSLAQKLMNDIRYMQPNAWVDWQYVESNNDQWCLVRGDFYGGTQAYERVKNYYVRQQFSRFIGEGYRFLTILNDQTLAATNAAADTLVLVSINPSGAKNCMVADLSAYASLGSGIEAYLTDESHDLSEAADAAVLDAEGRLTYTLPALSIMTVVLPVSAEPAASAAPVSGKSYLISPRRTAQCVVAASGSNVVLADADFSPTQVWTAHEEADGSFSFTSQDDKVLTFTKGYYLTAKAAGTSGQNFNVEAIDEPYFKITDPITGKAFDLEGEGITAGTKLGIWTYGTDATATHRQWTFVAVPEEFVVDGIAQASSASVAAEFPLIISRTACCALQLASTNGESVESKVYDATGRLHFAATITSAATSLPLTPGTYVVTARQGNSIQSKVVSVSRAR